MLSLNMLAIGRLKSSLWPSDNSLLPLYRIYSLLELIQPAMTTAVYAGGSGRSFLSVTFFFALFCFMAISSRVAQARLGPMRSLR